ncbi:MAG: SDR family oxidoreductase [Endomicrobium sp.]|uniref:SDR family oxidoreductase n=1 Tax=Candidatus Endomicrobiellum pyrsonymphae TaxID=1408203 RepID=UPI0035895916|nr:SDR family oxidoreductase [Endomicrobium sp.]
MEWNKKVAVITGAGGVLLSAYAKELASKGVRIAVLSRELKHAQSTADEIITAGNIAKAYGCDVLDKRSLIKTEEQIYKDFGQYHILINGAGGNMPNANTTNETFIPNDLNNPKVRSFFSLDSNEVEKVFSVNFLGTFLVTQIFAKRMLDVKGAVIINFSSMAAQCPMTKVLGYSASKAAIDNFTKWLAVHFAEHGLRVNAIAPGFFLTNQNKTLLTNSDGSLTERSHKIISHTPMRRFGKVDDLFGTLSWLCDEEASGFVTGSIIAVDGGFQAYSGV